MLPALTELWWRLDDRVDPCVDEESLLLVGDELRWRLRMACLSRKLIFNFKLGLTVAVVVVSRIT